MRLGCTTVTGWHVWLARPGLSPPGASGPEPTRPAPTIAWPRLRYREPGEKRTAYRPVVATRAAQQSALGSRHELVAWRRAHRPKQALGLKVRAITGFADHVHPFARASGCPTNPMERGVKMPPPRVRACHKLPVARVPVSVSSASSAVARGRGLALLVVAGRANAASPPTACAWASPTPKSTC